MIGLFFTVRAAAPAVSVPGTPDALRVELEQILSSQPWDYDPAVRDRIETILRTLRVEAEPVLVPKVAAEHLDGKGYHTAIYVIQILGRYGSPNTLNLLKQKYSDGYILDFPSLILKPDLPPEKQEQIEASLSSARRGLSARLRLALAASIVRLGDDTWFDSVLAGLGDPDPETARMGIICLGWTGTNRAVEILAGLAPDEPVVIALGDTRNPAAVPVLESFAGNISQPGLIRNYACRGLALIGGPEGMGALRKLWENAPLDDTALIRMSAEGMFKIDRATALEYLTQATTGTNNILALKAVYSFGLLKLPETTPALLELLKE